MKRSVLYLIASVFFVASLSAQPANPRFSQEEVINKKWTTISKRLKATDAELAIIEPIFRANEAAVWKLLSEHRAIVKANRQGDKSKIDFDAINKSLIQMEVDQTKLRQKYFKDLKGKISDEMLHQVLISEKVYQRELMQRNPANNKNNNNKQGYQRPNRPNQTRRNNQQ